eukprot:GHVO01021041.1.p2 GENE.GHVO01021041.1~~GHVO01021041.1.p2  ORF type:complete len:126 (+),score=18.30 GHVO01021041.1:1270-1647(+)
MHNGDNETGDGSMSNYPDNVDFSRMSWDQRTPRQDSEDAANERETASEQADIRCKAHDAARKVGAALKPLRLSERSLAIIAEAYCEELCSDDYYRDAIKALYGSYQAIEEALIKAARTQVEEVKA